MFWRYYLIAILLLITSTLIAQVNVSKEMRGNRKYRKEGIHNGNLVETLFYNFGEVAWWGRQPSGVWPKGSTHSYMDGITPIVVTQIVNGKGDTLYICEAGYRERMRIPGLIDGRIKMPVGTVSGMDILANGPMLIRKVFLLWMTILMTDMISTLIPPIKLAED